MIQSPRPILGEAEEEAGRGFFLTDRIILKLFLLRPVQTRNILQLLRSSSSQLSCSRVSKGEEQHKPPGITFYPCFILYVGFFFCLFVRFLRRREWLFLCLFFFFLKETCLNFFRMISCLVLAAGEGYNKRRFDLQKHYHSCCSRKQSVLSLKHGY